MTDWQKVLEIIPDDWVLTPVKEKRPLRPGWQTEKPIARDTLLQLLKDGQELVTRQGKTWLCVWTGIGIRLGQLSGNVLAVDADGEAAIAKLDDLSQGDIPETISWTSGKPGRQQLLFRIPNGLAKRITTQKILCAPDQYLEFRWDGAMSVLPPSVHPETGRYKWINSPANVGVADAPAWLVDYLEGTFQPAPVINTNRTYIPQKAEGTWGPEDYARSYLQALSSYRADDYDDWRVVGMALHSVGDHLLDDWENWSQQSAKYRPGECERKWRGFKPNGSITIGTLGKMAKDDGWRSPWGEKVKTKLKPIPSPALESSPAYKQTESFLYKNMPPSLIEAEMQLLGLLLLDLCNPLDVIGTIKEVEVFYDAKHQIIYRAMLTLHQKNMPTGYVPVLDHLISTNSIDNIGGKEYLNHLTDCPHRMQGTSAEKCSELLIDKWLRRELAKVSVQIRDNSYNYNESLDNLLDSSEKSLYRLRTMQTKKVTIHNAEVSQEAYERLYNPSRIYPTGFTKLDSKIVGWEDETLSVLAARSSMGKTTMALQCLLQFSLLHGKHCCYFSLEMTREQLEHRLWSLISVHPAFSHEEFDPLPGKRIRTHLSGIVPFTHEEMENVARIATAATELNISINDDRGISPSGIAGECRKLKSQSDNELGLIVIDYLQLFTSEGDAAETSNHLLATTRYFYNMAQELKCPVMLLAQVSRQPEGRKDKRPSMSDLAQSGGIEWIADNILLLYRDSYYNSDSDDTLEVICDKVRQGETGIAKLGYDLDRQLIYDN